MQSTEDDETHTLWYWEGPLNLRKIVERVIAGIIVGAAMGISFYAMGELFG